MTNLPEIPNNLNTVEKLHLWSALLLDRQNPTKRIIELPGEKPVNLIDVDIYRDGYNKKQVLCRANLPLQDFSLYEGNGLWNLADEIQKGDYNPDIEDFRDNSDVLPTPIDPYWDNVVLYLKGEGADDSTDIIDSSPNRKTITRFGDVKVSTDIDLKGSIYFDGNGDYLEVTHPTEFNNSTFTIDGYIYLTRSGLQAIISSFTSSNESSRVNHCYLSDQTRLRQDNGQVVNNNFNGTLTFPLNTLQHFAFVFNNGNIKIFQNGQLSANYTAQTYTGITIHRIGMFILSPPEASFYAQMYLNHLRITLSARYTTNFNPANETYLN